MKTAELWPHTKEILGISSPGTMQALAIASIPLWLYSVVYAYIGYQFVVVQPTNRALEIAAAILALGMVPIIILSAELLRHLDPSRPIAERAK